MENYLELLKKSKVFKDFAIKEIEDFIKDTDYIIKEYGAKQIIPIVPDKMIFVLQGMVHTIENSDSGTERIINICTPDTSSFIPVIVKKEYSSVNIVVKKKAVILFLPTTLFSVPNMQMLFLQNKIQQNLINMYNELQQENLTRAIITSETTARKRILRYLQFQQNKEENHVKKLKMTRDELADVLNIDVSTLMRELRLLKSEMGIEYDEKLL